MKLLCAFAISHTVTHYYAASHRVAWSVGLSVCLSLCQSVTLVSPAKTAETIKFPFAFRTQVGPMNHVLHEVQMPTWEGTIMRGKQANQYRDTLQSSVQTQLNWSRCRLGCGLAWAQSIMCYITRPYHPWERATLVDRRDHCKVQALSAVSCAKRLNRSICRLGCGHEWAERCTSSIIFARWRQCALMGVHVAVTCRITMNHPFTVTMPLMANYVDHLDMPTYSCTDSQALRAKYCIVGIPHNTAI